MLNWLINPSRLARLARSELLPDSSACVSPLAPTQADMPRLERWREAVRLAGMERALDPAATQGQLSLLVPEDTAFAAFEAELEQSGSSWAAFCEDRAGLRRWLLGHVLPQPCTAQALRSHRGAALDTLGAHALRLAPASDSLTAPTLLDASGRRAQLLSSRQTGPQRHLHVIDRVLQPAAQGLLDLLAQNPEHRDFLAALRSTGLDALLAGSGPFTVLAPSNAGMARLAPRLGLRERELARQPALLRQVLLQHLLPGDCPVNDLPWGGQLRTVAGEALSFSALGLLGEGEQLQPLLPGSDQLARNGRLHQVEQLLIPPSLQDEHEANAAADELTAIPLPLWRAPPCAPRSHAH
ncbi:fasciclin domain-containing protein [Paucibacter sp. DJ2R-2]|uniref:fasciclin domain-containing protein n=1 Tax=Paucibacter sp. DJ2R-2 TaxID=2893558 RepID=UPI0021E3D063|nr:fasciclin domain-containing protein [Paucibacter sp. DJ2R-2]MCV2420951.1 fasciclin domain-containing protein [Paucibacter sp. DJ4R-1]MCV2438929.1 fasciclin domain-containing protein [Paucibacter sp. DJ2R-2]